LPFALIPINARRLYMVRGFYTAASGLVTQEKKLNSISNNIANVSTAGYKRDGLVTGTFGEHMSVRMNAYQNRRTEDIGPGVFMSTIVDEYTDYSQGGFDQTNRALDFALAGEGYFVIANDEGEFLTRDGQFSLDEEGFLVLPGYGRVQGVDGDIQITGSRISVGADGTVSVQSEDPEDEPEQVGRLAIAFPDEETPPVKAGDLFAAEDYALAEEGDTRFRLRQGFTERSNVAISDEMTEMMATQRTLQSCSQIVKMYDQMTEQANSRLSRIR
jgi:flagellar basal-body rod protein FlgG